MLLSAASLMSGSVYATEAVVTIGSYEDLAGFINSLADNDYDGSVVTITADIKVNEGWNAKDGTKNPTAAPDTVLDTLGLTGAFKGTLDGGGHTVSGLYINGVALLPVIENATVKDVTFDNCYTNNAGNSAIVAGVLNANGNADFINVTVSNSKIVNGTTTANIGAILATVTGSTEGNYSEEVDGAVSHLNMTNCASVDNLIVSKAKTSLVGGLVGVATKCVSTFRSCLNSSEIEAVITESALANNGYKVGGILGYAGGNKSWVASFVSCVNEGKLTASSIVGGIFGHGGSTSAYLEACVNTGEITAGDTVVYTINKATHGGGLIGKMGDANATVKECINTGSINAVGTVVGTYKPGSAGGLIGYAEKPFTVIDTVNVGNVTAFVKAGGVVGECKSTSGIINRVITVGDIKGYNAGTAINNGASCSLFGTWVNTNENASVYFTITDFYYYNNNNNVFGLWQNLGTKKGNYFASYTRENKNAQVIGGVDNAAADGNVNNTQSKNLAIYNKFFIENGYISNLSSVCAENGAERFAVMGLGDRYVMTETVPMPASAFGLIRTKQSADEDVSLDGYQKKLDSDNLQVRFIAELSELKFANTGFEIYAVERIAEYTEANGSTVISFAEPTYGAEVLENNVSSTVVYTSLKAFGENGEELEPVVAEDGKYLSAITVSSLPAEGIWTIIIKPYVTLSDGIGVVYGAPCAMILTDGVVSGFYAM